MPMFDLVFTGELIEGCDPAQVRRDLERLFKTDATGISRLFTGTPVIIKKAVDQQTAMRYRAALQQAGALCQVRPVAAATASASTSATSAVSRPSAAPGLESATILPPGSILTEILPVPPPQYDFSGLSVAPPGEVLVQQSPQTFPPPPSPAAYHLAPAGEVLVEPIPITPAVVPDISALTMAPPRTEILKPGEVNKAHPPPPTPGDLSLAQQ